jgi:class 3 adenylate cyclase
MSSSSETPAPNSKRELAAIMFSDIAGYTLIMGRDEREGFALSPPLVAVWPAA